MKNRTGKLLVTAILVCSFMLSAKSMADQSSDSNNEDIAIFYSEKARNNISLGQYVMAEQDVNNGLEKIAPKLYRTGSNEQDDSAIVSEAKRKLLSELLSIRALTREFRGLHHAAISDYEKSLKHNQDSVESKYSLALLYYKHHMEKKARPLQNQIEKHHPEKAALLKQEISLIQSVRKLQNTNLQNQ